MPDHKTRTLEKHIEIDPNELIALIAFFKNRKWRQAADYARICAMCRFYNNLPSVKHEEFEAKYGYKQKLLILKRLHEIALKENLTGIPKAFRRFQDRFTWYKNEGWKGLLHGNIGNEFNPKISSYAALGQNKKK